MDVKTIFKGRYILIFCAIVIALLLPLVLQSNQYVMVLMTTVMLYAVLASANPRNRAVRFARAVIFAGIQRNSLPAWSFSKSAQNATSAGTYAGIRIVFAHIQQMSSTGNGCEQRNAGQIASFGGAANIGTAIAIVASPFDVTNHRERLQKGVDVHDTMLLCAAYLASGQNQRKELAACLFCRARRDDGALWM